MITICVFAATNLLKISHSELLSCPAPHGCDRVCYVTTIKREVFFPLFSEYLDWCWQLTHVCESSDTGWHKKMGTFEKPNKN